MPIIYTLISIVLGFAIGSFRVAFFLGLITAVISLFLFFNRKINSLNNELTQLRNALAKDWQDRQKKNKSQGIAATESAADSIPTQNTQTQPPSRDALPEKAASEKPAMVMANKKYAPIKKAVSFEEEKAPEPNKIDELSQKIIEQVKRYFTDGNLFVRIGILVLFFGVAFLLKYAAEHSQISIEFRFIGAALGGFILLIFGWRLRQKNTAYALLLQGAGIGVIYITIFAAYRIQELIPPLLTFILLIAFAGVSALLAVLQNSRALASFGILGGFLAPLLASSGSGNYVGLFSYYAILNIAVLMMAWHKSWRALNLIGFIFTFGVYAFWLVASYKPAMLISADLFLILFFIMYSAIGVLYALRQPIDMKGYVDGTLIFGTPLIATSLQMALVRHTEYGIAISAAAFGIYYILLTRFLWQRHGENLRLLAEAMLAIGVVFLTLAIPYALNGHWTSATWALEAAGILWVAIKQNRKYTQYFALLLQTAAGLLFLVRNVADVGTTAWINPAFMGGVFIALGGLITAWQLFKLSKSQPAASAGKLHLAFFVWGVLWWLISALLQIEHYVDNSITAVLLLFTATSWVFMHLSAQRQWQWPCADITAMSLIPAVFFVAMVSITNNHHALVMPDVFYWLPVIAVSYFIVQQLESRHYQTRMYISLYFILAMLVTLLISTEIDWRAEQAFNLLGIGWQGIVLALAPLFAMHLAHRWQWGALHRFGEPLRLSIIAALSIAVVFWSLGVHLANNGDAYPLPFMPLLNPIDLLHLFYFLFALRLYLSHKNNYELSKIIAYVTGSAGFLWINAMLLRSLHHYQDIPYQLHTMSHDIKAQIAISILWTILGCLAMLLASRKSLRTLWIIGGVLVGIVLVKMVTVDLGASGTVERIVSFLVVGSLLVGMGYFSPIPVKAKTLQEKTND